MVLSTVVMAWSTIYYIECLGYSLKSRRLVQMVYFMMLGLYVINGITDYIETKKEWAKKTDSKDSAKSEKTSSSILVMLKENKAVLLFATLILYVLALDFLGFILTTFICSFIILFIMGECRIPILVGMPIALVVILILIFKMGLNVPLPAGILGV
ncbi:MAG TPA: tripartite tricarboxylate transporter TctB family protein [Christensenellaceae bacterium]|nr:tripartite tricarboxylate transporter TctB family protein [Christensenellaceae bacterium]